MSGTLDRRQFSVAAALALLGGATITIGCGGGSSNPNGPNNNNPNPTLGPGDKAASVAANHGHIAVLTAAQLSAAGALSLDIRGQANHPHTVTLTAAEITQVASGARVSKESSQDDQHNHTVTFN
jgi:hypothetical protein